MIQMLAHPRPRNHVHLSIGNVRTGHQVDECKANLDCYICNKKKSYVSSKCPMLKMPKLSVSFPGFGKGELGFLRMPDFDFKLETPDPAPTALVKVTGGKLTAEVVQTELARLTRVDWNWEALPHGEDSFLVAYPSDEELKRLVDIDFCLKNHGVTLTISEWQESGDIIPSYRLDEVWVHVTGVPHAWRHYLGFWALGSVIGSTLEVDMWTYRKKGVLRILVGIINREQLPLTTDIVFDREGYHLTFTLEGNDFEPAIPPPDDIGPMDHDTAGFGKEGPSHGNPDQAAKKQKSNEELSNEAPTQTASGPSPMQHQIAVTPFGRNRPVPPAKPLVFMGDKPLPKIVVTPPKIGSSLAMIYQSLCEMDVQQNIQPENSNVEAIESDSGGSSDMQPAPIAIGSLASLMEVSSTGSPHGVSVSSPCSLQQTLNVAATDFACVASPVPTINYERVSETDSGPVALLPTCTVVTPDNTTTPDGPVKANPLGQAPSSKMKSRPASDNVGQRADEDLMLKAMKRTAIRNLDIPVENKTMVDCRGSPHSPLPPAIPMPGYLLDYTLAPYMGYSTEASFTGFGYCGISTIGACGQGIFYPGAWVAV